MTTRTPSMDLDDYTHEKLTARRYTRVEHSQYPGWVTYEPPGGRPTASRPKVGFADNNAMMGNWIEKVSQWEKNWPDLYKWWVDPKQAIFFEPTTNELLIKTWHIASGG